MIVDGLSGLQYSSSKVSPVVEIKHMVKGHRDSLSDLFLAKNSYKIKSKAGIDLLELLLLDTTI